MLNKLIKVKKKYLKPFNSVHTNKDFIVLKWLHKNYSFYKSYVFVMYV